MFGNRRGRGRRPALGLAAVLCLGVLGAVPARGAKPGAPPPVSTFSIVAVDTTNGEWGVAVASRFLAVGAVVPWAKAGVGAVATQALANTRFGPEGLTLLQHGLTAAETLDRLLARDSRPQTRQVGIVDAMGGSASFTGARCAREAASLRGPGYAIQGNLLADEAVLSVMAEAFLHTDGPLADRLLAALEAGDREGGDRRGKESAALLVVKAGGGYGGGNDRYVDLRVDDAPDPVGELKRLYRLHAHTVLPGVDARLGDEALALGDRRRAEREYSRVINLYREAMEEAPDDPAPRNGLAWFYARHRVNLDEAVRLANEALRLDPDSWEILDTLAEVYAAKGKKREAAEFARRALAADPGNKYLEEQADRFTRLADPKGRAR